MDWQATASQAQGFWSEIKDSRSDSVSLNLPHIVTAGIIAVVDKNQVGMNVLGAVLSYCVCRCDDKPSIYAPSIREIFKAATGLCQ